MSERRVPRGASRRAKTTRKQSALAPAATARALLAEIDRLAPLHLAPDWDNVGLIAGELDWPATRVLTALDLSQEVADEAIGFGCDALVLYHPPIFKPQKRVGAGIEGPPGRIARLLGEKIGVFAVHTALDIARDGTNDALLDAFEIGERWPLETSAATVQQYKLIVFVPPAELATLRTALAAAGAGVIGDYSECGFSLLGQGSFRGGSSTNPNIGQRGRLEFVEEARLEMVVPARAAGAVVRALYAAHSYEEPAFDLYPLHAVADRGQSGLGRVGVLRRPQQGMELLAAIGKIADLSIATSVGDLSRRFSRVVAAAGSFGVEKFRDRDALVITGEFKHHDALALLDRGVSAIALGHDASERPGWARFTAALRRDVPGATVSAARRDQSPFSSVQRAPRSATPRDRRTPR